MFRSLIVATATTLCLVSGCTTNSVTGERQFHTMSFEQQVALGSEQYNPSQQQQGGRYVVDPELNLYVSNVGQKLAAYSKVKLPYEFVVLDNDVPNAWALPGGKIAVNRGLLILLEDEAQLAAVLGHEIIHAAAEHGASQMMKAQMLGLGVAAAGLASKDSDYATYIGLGTAVGAQLYQAHYGRSQELESDKYGIEYMVKAGYDPQAAVELQQTFVKLSESRQSDLLSNLFASHPPSQERVERNRELAAKHSGGVRNKAAYQKAIAQLKKDQPAYDAHNAAQEAASKEDFASALSNVNKAIKLQPQAALFYITKGNVLRAQKNNNEALAAYQKARQLNPDYVMGYLGEGITAFNLDKKSVAQTALESSMKILQTPIAAFHLGEIAREKGDKQTALSYYQFAANDKGELGQAAQERAAQMQGLAQ